MIVNLDSGRYYSLQDAGAAMWNALIAGATVDDVVEMLAHRYETDQDTLQRSTIALIDELLREELIAVRSIAPTWLAPTSVNGRESRPFHPPTLQTYTDMQDLLLLDPIHEVDDAGWPKPADKGPDAPSA